MRTSLLVFGDAATGEQSSGKIINMPKKATIETSLKAVGFDRQKYGLCDTRGVVEI